ncbi:MAG TPA: WD40 repeat domain-containing protein [Solirubrobacterales bacterium]|nr:WD40 repeat domain-containing protein [Solirubrobacterales bacterium]
MTLGAPAARTRARSVDDPYVGLTYFTEEYVDYFFGRDAESSLIIGNLRAARLTLLYAESGVGKSSVLRAGVVARLRGFAERDAKGRGSPRLVPVIFSSWSGRPVADLVGAIGAAIAPYLAAGSAPEMPVGDLEAALAAASEAIDATLLLVLDQFEEYFLYPDDAPEEERIAAQLDRCVARPDLRANFLVSIREDSYAELGQLFRGRSTNVYGNFLHMDRLGRVGGREAIERPLERRNESMPESEPFSIEPELVDAVLDQVGRDRSDERIETTFLQLVMRRLWEEEGEAGSRVLRLSTLEKLGGAQAIIGSHLDRAMESDADGAGGLSLEQRRVAAQVFRFLVTSGGTKIALTTSDLADLTGLPATEIEPVVRHLSSPGLHILRAVVFQDGEAEPRFEIFHDALADPIVKWRTRVKEEEREAGARQEREEKEEARRAAAAAEGRAARERRRRQFAQVLLGLVVLLLLGGAIYIALHQRSVSEQRSATNQSVRAAERIAELAHAPSFGPPGAALASVEDYGLWPTTEAREQELAALQRNPGLPLIFIGHTRAVTGIAYWPRPGTPRSENLATAGADRTVRLWGPQGSEVDGSPLIARGGLTTVAVSPPAADGTRMIAAGLATGRVELWRTDGAGEVPKSASSTLLPAAAGSGPVRGLAFSPRNPDLLAAGGTGVTLWDLKGIPFRQVRRPGAGDVEDLAFTSDGRRLLVATTAGGRSFGLTGAGFAAGRPVPLGGRAASAVATGPHGAYALGGEGWIAVRGGVRGPTALKVPGQVTSLAFAAAGGVLVAAGKDWNVTTWDLATGRSFGPPRTAEKTAIDDVAVSPNGRTIAAAGADGMARLWPLRPRRSLATIVGSISAAEAPAGEEPTIWGLTVGAGGLVAAADGAAGTSIWSLKSPPSPDAPPRPVARIPGTSYAVASHKDILITGSGNSFVVYGVGKECGKGIHLCRLAAPTQAFSEVPVKSLVVKQYGSRLLLASTAERGGEGFFNLWDLRYAADGKVVHLPSSSHLRTSLECLTFSPRSPLLAAGGRDGKTRVWDLSDLRRPPRELHFGHAHGNEKQPVDAIAFSRDGSWLASGGGDQQVVLWTVSGDPGDVSVERTPGTMLQGQSIFALAFSPKGNTLAAGDGEGVTCLYDVATRREIGNDSCLLGHKPEAVEGGGINALKFAGTSDGKVLLTAGGGQSIVAWSSVLWNGSGAAPVERKIRRYECALAHQNLTENEWSTVFSSTAIGGSFNRRTCSRYGPVE